MKALYSALGRSPGSLFTAIVRERPDRVVVLTSPEAARALPEIELAARAHHPSFTLTHDNVNDPFTDLESGRRWALEQSGAMGADDGLVVNIAGGSTALQDALLTLARLTGAPCYQTRCAMMAR